ncbi:MAG: RecX family transcriptional regulator [Lewinella sp.]|nr:RecX family transcriptional regulator [Lewinella sp.]
MKRSAKPYLTKEQALQKLQRYCAYQDRCHQEVRFKLLDLGVYGDTLEEIMAELVEERFLDEERFARSFARGKFRMKQWGRVRIRRELKQRDISDYCIRQAMTEIDDAAYDNTLRELLRNRWLHYAQENDDFKRRQKTAAVALRRGFEPELVWAGIRQLTD